MTTQDIKNNRIAQLKADQESFKTAVKMTKKELKISLFKSHLDRLEEMMEEERN